MDNLIMAGIFMSLLLTSIAVYDYLTRKKHNQKK